ncbi:class A beta-lactamase-related serine hydrolase [Catellatospora sp. KI3]|uniref:serine hydrolase n=1 Tax=Catellatospora sp. KI3 TaxID=3041620 RepID=UPI002482FE95|nr:serine hydrolase [Catellatospora sp. KI3]MDI1465441.1 class A beta-lactamase-related serine hydrolase [Catellatospora sp. KI3]
MSTVQSFEQELAAFPGTASVWFGPVGGPAAYARAEHARHYAASTMKVGVMVAAWRAAEAGSLDLDAPVLVHNEHVSTAPGAPAYRNDPEYDSDEAVWARLGEQVPLRWLATRMIVKSSNLATNLVLAALGPNESAFAQVNEVWRLAGAVGAHTDRGIEDYPARDAGISNEVTAADLAALFGALESGRLASPAGSAQMIDVLAAQECRDDLHRGLPADARVALKNGWVPRERHSSAIVYPAGAQPYLLAVCTTGDLSDEQACDLLGRIAAASWAERG